MNDPRAKPDVAAKSETSQANTVTARSQIAASLTQPRHRSVFSQAASILAIALGVLVLAGVARDGSLKNAQTGAAGTTPEQTQAVIPLSANDVSWLFPVPMRAEDFSNLIAVRDLTSPNRNDPTQRDPVWPDAVFQQFLAIDSSPAAQVAGTPISIGLPAEAHRLTAGDDDQTHVEKELEGLKDVADMASPWTKDAEANVAEVLHWIAVTVHLKEHAPDLVASVTREGTEDGVQGDGRAPAQLRERPTSRKGTENVGGNEVENRTPCRRSCCSGGIDPLPIGDLPAVGGPVRCMGSVALSRGLLLVGWESSVSSTESCFADG